MPVTRNKSERSLSLPTSIGGEHRVHPPHRPRRKLHVGNLIRLIGGLALGFGLIAWGVIAEFPTGPKSGSTLSGNVAPLPFPGKSLRVGTFNIHGGVGRDEKFDLSRTAGALQGLELIGLNEVHRRRMTKADQAELLATKLETNWLFAPTEYCWRGDHFGSALLSRLQINHWQRIPLEHRTAAGYRNLLLLSVPLQKGTLSVIITHADRTTDREHQLRAIFALFNSLAEPALLMGDLNTHRSDPLLTGYIDSGAWTDCVGEKIENDPFNRIDWILTRGIKPLAAGLIDNGASDHPCAWAELDLSPWSESSN